MPNAKHALFAVASIAACTGQSGPQNDGPPPTAIALANAQAEAYTIGVTVGGQMFNAVLDTGSSTLAVAGASCSNCTGVSPLYTPGSSAMDLGSGVDASYGIGEWMGELYSDSVTVTGDALAPFSMKFGDVEAQTDFFQAGGTADAIIGFNPQVEVPGTDTYIADRVNAGDSGVFAIQLCPYNGTLWFGGADKTHEVSDEQYAALAPMGSDQPYYEIALQSATIGGVDIGLSGAAVPDTGTTTIVLPTDAGNAFAAAVNASSGYQSIFSGQAFKLSAAGMLECSLRTTKSASDIDAALPKFEITLNDLDGNPFTLSMNATESYLHAFGDQYCVDVAELGDAPAVILGDAFLTSFISVFDPVNSKIGFAPQQGCAYPTDAKLPVSPRVPFVHGHPASRGA
jgi:hypothetical protein